MSASPLDGLHRFVTFPSTVSGVAGAAVGFLYAFSTVEFPATGLTSLFIVVAAIVGIATLLGDRQEQRTLQMVKALATKSAPPTVENLSQAVRELSRIPDVSFVVNLAFWVIGASAIGVVYSQVSTAGFQVAARLAFIGIALGPLIATLGYVAVVKRSREAITRVAAAGLAPKDVIAAVPAGRMQLQRRLVLYAAVAVGTPLLLICDIAVLRMEGTFTRVLAEQTVAAQKLALATELDVGLESLFAVAAVLIILVVVGGFSSGSALSEPMRLLAAKTQAMTRGRLGGSGIVAGEDEIWAVAAGFTTLETQLVLIVKQLQGAGQKIQRTTDELGSSRSKHERGASEQTSALAQTSATTEELARSAKQIALNATQVKDLASQTLDAARLGKHNADQLYTSILKVREGNQAIADSVVKLNKRVQQVGRIVEFIDGIADKSDLLALNAELEGNKAGEVGRGFSLVAAEMRRLSESVMNSTREIIGLIHEVRDATNAAVMATEAGVKASDTGSALARRVSEGLSDILEFATTTADAVQRITLATHQQQVGTDQLAQAMSDILRSTRDGDGASKKMAAANSDLQALASELKSTVDRFEVS